MMTAVGPASNRPRPNYFTTIYPRPAIAYFAVHHMMIIIQIRSAEHSIEEHPVMATASDPVVIVSAARSPLGKFMGDLSPFSAHRLGSHVIAAAVERAKLSPDRGDELFM